MVHTVAHVKVLKAAIFLWLLLFAGLTFFSVDAVGGGGSAAGTTILAEEFVATGPDEEVMGSSSRAPVTGRERALRKTREFDGVTRKGDGVKLIVEGKSDIDLMQDMECPVCQSVHEKRLRLKACGHTCCGICMDGVRECPVCREAIQGLEKNSRELDQWIAGVNAECKSCGYLSSFGGMSAHFDTQHPDVEKILDIGKHKEKVSDAFSLTQNAVFSELGENLILERVDGRPLYPHSYRNTWEYLGDNLKDGKLFFTLKSGFGEYVELFLSEDVGTLHLFSEVGKVVFIIGNNDCNSIRIRCSADDYSYTESGFCNNKDAKLETVISPVYIMLPERMESALKVTTLGGDIAGELIHPVSLSTVSGKINIIIGRALGVRVQGRAEIAPGNYVQQFGLSVCSPLFWMRAILNVPFYMYGAMQRMFRSQRNWITCFPDRLYRCPIDLVAKERVNIRSHGKVSFQYQALLPR